jgi:hypothetical protein
MNELAEPMVFENQSILPAQFLPHRRDYTRMHLSLPKIGSE